MNNMSSEPENPGGEARDAAGQVRGRTPDGLRYTTNNIYTQVKQTYGETKIQKTKIQRKNQYETK